MESRIIDCRASGQFLFFVISDGASTQEVCLHPDEWSTMESLANEALTRARSHTRVVVQQTLDRYSAAAQAKQAAKDTEVQP